MSAHPQKRNEPQSPRNTSRPWLRAGFWICIFISVAVVVRRLYAFARPPQGAPPQLAALDSVFASHATLTLAHILPALAFVIVAPFVVLDFGSRRIWAERMLFPLGAIVGLTAYAMSAHPVGGWIEFICVKAKKS
jgi:hypothetical protein